ncbi:hypothetical protein NDU88_005511 [Pleurodeles waltl]|uniref:Uncharacterized protein n=1 Tax=Pleurodeles waltl TaxID=8319 RepID=A0AAV7VNJ6_PLEWA|nr:hypothetical protein NDU88_005511 [Pleurodeles waltl]
MNRQSLILVPRSTSVRQKGSGLGACRNTALKPGVQVERRCRRWRCGIEGSSGRQTGTGEARAAPRKHRGIPLDASCRWD